MPSSARRRALAEAQRRFYWKMKADPAYQEKHRLYERDWAREYRRTRKLWAALDGLQHEYYLYLLALSDFS